jgi:hypothetical protein
MNAVTAATTAHPAMHAQMTGSAPAALGRRSPARKLPRRARPATATASTIAATPQTALTHGLVSAWRSPSSSVEATMSTPHTSEAWSRASRRHGPAAEGRRRGGTAA